MKFASRMARLGTETAFEVLAEVTRLREQGKNVVSFAIGEPDFDTPANIREAAKRALDAGWTHYGPSSGLPQLRETVARHISATRHVDAGAERVVIVPGGKPVIFFAMLALIEPGDEVIYPNPGYPIYESMIEFCGGTAVPLPLLEEKSFSFDPDQLARLVTPRTRMVVVNSPQNPTGGVIPLADLEVLARLAVERDFWVLSDEIYSRILYEGTHRSIISLPGMLERTILLDGHSKVYAMTGWRLGYGVMPEELAVQVARLMTNSSSCTASFTQIAGIEALEGAQDACEEMVQRFRARRDLIVSGLDSIPGISCRSPAGAFYVFPNVTGVCRSKGFADSRALARHLLLEGNVAVLGRNCFGKRNRGEEAEYIRLSYAASRADIEEGIRRMREALS